MAVDLAFPSSGFDLDIVHNLSTSQCDKRELKGQSFARRVSPRSLDSLKNGGICTLSTSR